MNGWMDGWMDGYVRMGRCLVDEWKEGGVGGREGIGWLDVWISGWFVGDMVIGMDG